MNFGFNFENQQEDLNKINQQFYRKLLEEKLQLITENGLEPKGKKDGKKKDDDSDSDDDDDDKSKKSKKGKTEVKDGVGGEAHIPGKKRIIKVLAIVQEPYIYKKSGEYTGIVYDIWKQIKAELAKKYDFDETFIKTINYTRQVRRVQAGEYDIALTSLSTNAKRSRMVNFTRPLYINQQALLSIPKRSYIEYLGKVAVELFLPPLGLLVALGVTLGTILYFIEPNRGYKEAAFGTVASMFGEMGGVVEGSDLKAVGMVVVFIIMTISFYFSIFLQAATVEKLIEFKQDEMITVDNINEKKILYAKGSGMGRAFKRLGAEVKAVDVDDIEQLKKKYKEEQPKWDAIALSFMDAYSAEDEDFKINDTNFGLSEQAIGVRIGENRLLKDLDVTITKLQDAYEIKRIYNHYFGDEYDFMGIL